MNLTEEWLEQHGFDRDSDRWWLWGPDGQPDILILDGALYISDPHAKIHVWDDPTTERVINVAKALEIQMTGQILGT